MNREKLLEEQYKALVEREGHLVDATTAFERFLIRVPLLLNGGALVVFLAVVGASHKNVAAGALSFEGRWVVRASFIWGMALCVAALSALRAWYGQYQHLKATRRARDKIEAEYEENIAARHEAKTNRTLSRLAADRATRDAKILWAIAMAMFLAGMWIALGSVLLP